MIALYDVAWCVCVCGQTLHLLAGKEWSETDAEEWEPRYDESSFPWGHLPTELLWTVLEYTAAIDN